MSAAIRPGRAICPIGDGNHKSVSCYFVFMDEEDPELRQLLKLELWAFRRCERLRGYPPDVQAVALTLKVNASEAVRDYRAKHPHARLSGDVKRRKNGGY
jgi:hypothetical protein